MTLDYFVADLKRAIEEKEGVPIEQQRLIFAGRQIDDSLPLAHYARCAACRAASRARAESGESTPPHFVRRPKGAGLNLTEATFHLVLRLGGDLAD